MHNKRLLCAIVSPSRVFLRPSAPTTVSNSKLATGWSAGRIAALHPSTEQQRDRETKTERVDKVQSTKISSGNEEQEKCPQFKIIFRTNFSFLDHTQRWYFFNTEMVKTLLFCQQSLDKYNNVACILIRKSIKHLWTERELKYKGVCTRPQIVIVFHISCILHERRHNFKWFVLQSVRGLGSAKSARQNSFHDVKVCAEDVTVEEQR